MPFVLTGIVSAGPWLPRNSEHHNWTGDHIAWLKAMSASLHQEPTKLLTTASDIDGYLRVSPSLVFRVH